MKRKPIIPLTNNIIKTCNLKNKIETKLKKYLIRNSNFIYASIRETDITFYEPSYYFSFTSFRDETLKSIYHERLDNIHPRDLLRMSNKKAKDNNLGLFRKYLFFMHVNTWQNKYFFCLGSNQRHIMYNSDYSFNYSSFFIKKYLFFYKKIDKLNSIFDFYTKYFYFIFKKKKYQILYYSVLEDYNVFISSLYYFRHLLNRLRFVKKRRYNIKKTTYLLNKIFKALEESYYVVDKKLNLLKKNNYNIGLNLSKKESFFENRSDLIISLDIFTKRDKRAFLKDWKERRKKRTKKGQKTWEEKTELQREILISPDAINVYKDDFYDTKKYFLNTDVPKQCKTSHFIYLCKDLLRVKHLGEKKKCFNSIKEYKENNFIVF